MFAQIFIGLAIATLSSVASAQTVPAVQSALGRVGQGYDHRSHAFRSSCLGGSFAYAGASSTSIAVEKTMSEDQLNAVTHSHISGKVNLFAASAELSASYYRSIQTHSKSLTMSWGRIVKGKTVLLTEPTLTADGIKARDSGDPTLRHLLCGDGFLNQIDLGASVVLTATIHFANASYRDEFLAKIKYKVLAWKRVKELKAERHWAHKFSHIDFSGYQIGGDPAKLDDILAKAKKTTCTIADMESCFPAMKALEDYAFGPDGLTKQLHDLKYSAAGAYAPLFYHFARYQDHGFGELEAGNFPDLAARDEVLAIVGPLAAKSQGSRGQALLLLGSGRLLGHERQRIDAALKDIDHNIAALANIRAVCVSTPKVCRETYYAADMRDIDPAVFDVPDRLTDYCRWSKAQGADIGLGRLMVELTKLIPGECEDLEEQKERITALNIAGMGIDTIAPLAHLPNLAVIEAGYNQISNSRPLLKLSALRRVNLRDNILQSAGVFEQIGSLKSLNLAYNRITDANPLADAGLDVLKLHGNPLSRYQTVEQNRHKFRLLTLKTKDICDFERQRLRKTGYDPKVIDKHERFNFSPWYIVPHKPKSGVEGWYQCDYIAKDYL